MKKKKIAILFDGDINGQHGMFNAIRNRICNLASIADYDIDVFAISNYEPWYIRLMRKTRKYDRAKTIAFDGITYHMIWKKFSLVDYFLDAKLHCSPFFQKFFEKKVIKLIRGYDIISVHSTRCGYIASKISERDHIPFYVTWHGSDIHTTPFINTSALKTTQFLLEKASCNFFVSKVLQETGKKICPNMHSEVLYNGVGDVFYRYTSEDLAKVRNEFNLSKEDKVVAFVGGLIEVKNPHLLPLIFEAAKKKYTKGPLKFWVIGSGKLQSDVRHGCEDKDVSCVFWGEQQSDKMPLFMNCIDVLVLPSRNEGLPLVTVEALACGANVVGSAVGGIGESIGDENVFPHGEAFVNNISDRIVYMLSHHVEQPLRDVFSWKRTAELENKIYCDALTS